MESNSSRPPLPERPGRVVQIQSIDSLKPESKPNEYVDTNTITAGLTKPKRPPKLDKLDKLDKTHSKSNFTKDIERCENATNELREHFQARSSQPKSVKLNDSQSPELPPRRDRPPQIPPRDSKNSCRQKIGRPVPVPPPPVRNQPVPQQCNLGLSPDRRQVRPTTNNSKLQPSVLILPESSGFPQFSTLRPNRNDNLSKDLKLPLSQQPVTQQPQASNVTLTVDRNGENSILCPECRKCRCSNCTGDRKLPERWLCEGNCRCSADSVVDTLSCMCCVKSCFKNCIDNPEGTRVHPCSCTDSPKCLLRWTALAALSLCLPCLCCYGPLQLGVCAATACYNSSCCRKQGCNCDKN